MPTTLYSLPSHAVPLRGAEDPRALYFDLLQPAPDNRARDRAADFLDAQLALGQCQPCDLPEDPAELDAWVERNTREVGRQYRAYLEGRRAGQPRRFFSTRAHAQHFLQGVAPTKLVDGAWLYGLLGHWRDGRFTGLIQTYLEELGEGDPALNHVVLYRQLLARLGGEHWRNLDATHFIQGVIQLALAEHAGQYLPEVIGFNLGYEQLPLHLLITAYELNELGIDPYYFTLHVTVDNAHTGHAQKALQAVRDAWPQMGDGAAFYQRVRNGYNLNALGASTVSVIAAFDPFEEVVRLLQAKCPVGSLLHSDYCRFDGRTVNQWLAEPELIPQFLDQLQRRGWIKRHQDPAESRFWQLFEGERAPMFGVFDAHERQLIHDWIAGDWLPDQGKRCPPRLGVPRAEGAKGKPSADDFDEEARLLQQEVARLKSREARLQRLLPLLAPRHHHRPAGLLATQLFARAFNGLETHG
ncbi:iron-containing redox enzyme family protein [Stutzerimonas tarimensis]|uniref:Iron-containing redox enzyme family protein n=1 Tax=Stutzerimonas tarimensis TaxID=1507735 RepID=A0ABV7T6R9_9GAMM